MVNTARGKRNEVNPSFSSSNSLMGITRTRSRSFSSSYVNVEKVLSEFELLLRKRPFKTVNYSGKYLVRIFPSFTIMQLPLFDIPTDINRHQQISHLILSSNYLTILPNEIGQLSNLITLDLCNNRLSSLPPTIGSLLNLQVLKLVLNEFMELPKEVCLLVSLQVLNIGENMLTKLPDELVKLTNLRIIDVHTNKLSALPKNFKYVSPYYLFDTTRSMTALSEINISYNSFPDFPPDVQQLPNLRKVFATSMRAGTPSKRTGRRETLKTFPSVPLSTDIGQLNNLVALKISQNALNALPKELGQLVKLKHLDIH